MREIYGMANVPPDAVDGKLGRVMVGLQFVESDQLGKRKAVVSLGVENCSEDEKEKPGYPRPARVIKEDSAQRIGRHVEDNPHSHPNRYEVLINGFVFAMASAPEIGIRMDDQPECGHAAVDAAGNPAGGKQKRHGWILAVDV